MYKINYDLDYSALKDFVKVVNKRLGEGSHSVEAIKTAGQYVTSLWIKNAGAKFKHTEGGYVQGILDGVQYPYNNDKLHLYIENKSPYAYFLEVGVQPFDLKKILETSSKVRVAKDGSRYLIIPFRFGTPGSLGLRSMPDNIYNEAKDLRASTIINTASEGVQQRGGQLENPIPASKSQAYVADATGMKFNNPDKTKRNVYSWGDRLTDVGEIYEGMYKFQKNVTLVREQFMQNTPLGKFTYSRAVNKTDNNTAYSNYMNFRVMSENSTGWLHPGIDAMNLAKNTANQAKEPVTQILKEGVMQDLKDLGFTV
jgi:hypothetical protein